MSSAAYMTDVSKNEQREPNQTALDLDPRIFISHLCQHNICSR